MNDWLTERIWDQPTLESESSKMDALKENHLRGLANWKAKKFKEKNPKNPNKHDKKSLSRGIFARTCLKNWCFNEPKFNVVHVKGELKSLNRIK